MRKEVKRILLLDDDPEARKAIRRRFRGWEVDIREAQTPEEAREGAPYDAIISEWGVGETPGESMVRSLEGMSGTLWIYSRRPPRGIPDGVTGVIRWGRRLELLEELNRVLGPMNPSRLRREGAPDAEP